MPGNEVEQRIQVRAFSGVDIETDPAFLPADTLQAAQNLVPQLTYLLQKRYGTALWTDLARSDEGLPWASPRIDVMQWALRTTGEPVLYFVVTTLGDGVTTAKGDRLYAAVGGPVPAVMELWNFDTGDLSPGWVSTSGGRYGMTILGSRVYVGNGVNPLVVVTIATDATTTTAPIGSFAITALPDAALAISAASAGLLSGIYSYRWGYLDTSVPDVSTWLSLTQTETIVVTGADPQAITFTGPSAGDISGATDPVLAPLDADHTVHLFLSPPGFPIEYARDHGMLDTASGTLTVAAMVVDSELTPLRGVAFTGRYLQRHRARVWVSGDQTNSLKNVNRLYSTNVVVPGLEQQLYNYGDFFPALANTQIGGSDGDEITGLAVVGGGVNKDVAASPIAIFKKSSIWAWFGDLENDPGAALVQVSDRIGCVAPQSIVSTSEGIFFLGIDSVYFLRAGFVEPIDVGLPIRPAILNCPKPRLQYACATYHRGFYKLALTPSGTQTNSQQWWLDLRPSMQSADIGLAAHWWGPHVCTPVSTMTVAQLDPLERERLYVGRECAPTEAPPIVTICIADQKNLYTDTATLASTVPVSARLRTGGLVQNDPFGWKDYNGVRIVTLPNRDTPVTVTTYADGGNVAMRPTMNQNMEIDSGQPNDLILTGSGTAIWNVSFWNQAFWGSRKFVEGWSILAPPVRAHSLEVQLVHADPSGVLIRDLEVTYDPIQRRAPGAR